MPSEIQSEESKLQEAALEAEAKSPPEEEVKLENTTSAQVEDKVAINNKEGLEELTFVDAAQIS